MSTETASPGPPSVAELTVFVITGAACLSCREPIPPEAPAVPAGHPGLAASRLHETCREEAESTLPRSASI